MVISAVRRNPHKIRTDDTNIAIPTVPTPMVLSCHGVALWPTPEFRSLNHVHACTINRQWRVAELLVLRNCFRFCEGFRTSRDV